MWSYTKGRQVYDLDGFKQMNFRLNLWFLSVPRFAGVICVQYNYFIRINLSVRAPLLVSAFPACGCTETCIK